MSTLFEIDKPVSHLSYTSMVIKYIVLFIVFFLGSWVALTWLIMGRIGRRSSGFGQVIVENAGLISIFISIAIIGWFIYRAWKKYHLGEVFSMQFNDEDRSVTFSAINVVNNSEKTTTYLLDHITYRSRTTRNLLFGKQRIVTVFEKNKKVHEINLDRTSWCRHEEIDQLLERLEVWNYQEKENYR